MHTEVEAARTIAELAARGPHTELDAARALASRRPGSARLEEGRATGVRLPSQRVPAAQGAPAGIVEA